MSAPKRRVSSSSGLLKMCDDENSDDDDISVNTVGLHEKSIYTFPKKANSRRRSSFGGANSSRTPVNAAEQSRIAEMYKTVIQMSSENKLNEKNSWNYDLIDHMGNLIKDDTRGVNFQKASCTLDASVKIYSNRVDDTYSTSHRILESLSRNGTAGGDEAADEHGNDGDSGAEGDNDGPRKKSSKTSTRLNIAQTIERNVSALNAVKLENDVAVDPMFHKISKAFDEGGAKGMLMNNLRVSGKGSSLSFHFIDASATKATASSDASSTPTFSNMINLADLLQRSEITVASLAGQSVCPALTMYRDQICLPKEETYLAKLSEVLTSTSAHAWPTAAAGDDSQVPIPTATSQSQAGDMDWEDSNHDNDFGADYGDDGGDDYEQNAPPASSRTSAPFATNVSAVPSPAGSTVSEFKKLRWDDLPGDAGASHSGAMSADMEMLTQGLESITISNAGPSEYSYFDTSAVFSATNAWAGARHWKYATRKRTAAVGDKDASAEASQGAENGGEETVSTGKKSKKTTKKPVGKSRAEAGVIEFSSELVDVSLFDLHKGKSKTDATVQTSATLSRQDASANTLFLPPDAKVQVKDLCRLYLAPLVMIPATAQQKAVLAQSAAAAKQRSGSSKIDKFLSGQAGSERVWGLSAPTNVQTATRTTGGATMSTSNSQGLNASFEDDGGDGGFGDYDADDFYEGSNENAAPASNALQPALTGLGINESQLLQADRKVEKIEIGYAKVSKRVNIQRLKTDIWGNIRTNMPSVEPENSPLAASSLDPSKGTVPQTALSFQDMICELAAGDEVRQKDVTLPFYFICLLHLANEHNLKIEDMEDMSDLIITPGMK